MWRMTSLPPKGHPDPPQEPTAFQQAVMDVVRAIPPGVILTYGEVGAEAGHPGSAQAVGNLLRRVPGLPWWRVVPATGRLYQTHVATQRPLLEAEGIRFDDRRILPGPAPSSTSPAGDQTDLARPV
jgi:methylated-DNA-protein-cysteine methyltransferase related protein